MEKALGSAIPKETVESVREEAEIEGIGEFLEFNPHNDSEHPAEGGIYVFYDKSDRPLYVGESESIKRRIRDHLDKFWFRRPLVETAAYISVEDKKQRKKIEKILIKFLKSNAVLNDKHVER